MVKNLNGGILKTNKFLIFFNFCDKKVQLDTQIPPIFGTGFTKTSTKKIDFPKREKIVGIQVDEEGVPEKKKE